MDLEALLKQNKEEIREDDSRKEQSLAQFREWLSKHPFIVKCRTGKLNISKSFSFINFSPLNRRFVAFGLLKD
jgi:hypothetical protein